LKDRRQSTPFAALCAGSGSGSPLTLSLPPSSTGSAAAILLQTADGQILGAAKVPRSMPMLVALLVGPQRSNLLHVRALVP